MAEIGSATNLDDVLRNAGFMKMKAIPLEIEMEESNVFVIWTDICEWGQGDTFEDALTDFTDSLISLCELVFAGDVKLGDYMQQIKETISEYIRPAASA